MCCHLFLPLQHGSRVAIVVVDVTLTVVVIVGSGPGVVVGSDVICACVCSPIKTNTASKILFILFFYFKSQPIHFV